MFSLADPSTSAQNSATTGYVYCVVARSDTETLGFVEGHRVAIF